MSRATEQSSEGRPVADGAVDLEELADDIRSSAPADLLTLADELDRMAPTHEVAHASDVVDDDHDADGEERVRLFPSELRFLVDSSTEETTSTLGEFAHLVETSGDGAASIFETDPIDVWTSPHEHVDELERWGATGTRISTASQHYADRPNIPHQHDRPGEVGVAVRFRKEGERADQEFAIACDRWETQRENARAIALYVKRKRLAERCGVTTAHNEVDVAALPPGEEDGATAVQPDGTIGDDVDDGLDREPHEVLGVAPDAREETIRGAYQELVKAAHGDGGGDRDLNVQELQQARDEMLEGDDA